MQLLEGAQVGPYEVVALLGAGGRGEVYRARDSRLGRHIALKVLTGSLAADRDALARFEREARTASALNHPHIVQIYDIGEASTTSGSIHYITMELVDGNTLREKLDAGADWRTLLEPLAQVAEALTKAHQAGIVHRDLKPENVMITSDGYAKVLDFGLAKLAERASLASSELTETMEGRTRSGVIVGTPGYMSPEQVLGRRIDHRSDIFSFGSILYEAMTGRRPFRGDSSMAKLHATVYAEPVPVESINSEAPPQVIDLIRRCLAKDPEKREASLERVARELRSIAAAGAHRRRTMGTRRLPLGWFGVTGVPPRKHIARAAAAATVIVGVAVLGWWARRRAPAAAVPRPMGIEKITSRGDTLFPVWSPDGKGIAYLTAVEEQARGAYSLWLHDLTRRTETRLAGAFVGHVENMGLSRDGRNVFLLMSEGRPREDLRLRVYRVPIEGGEPELVRDDRVLDLLPSPGWTRVAVQRAPDALMTIEDLDGRNPVRIEGSLEDWSSDEMRFLGLRSEKGVPVLVTAGLDGRDERVLARLSQGGRVELVRWRPDERAAVCVVWKDKARALFVADLVTGEVRPFGDRVWPRVGDVTWLPDGSGILLEASDDRNQQIWLVDFPQGRARPVTSASSYHNMSLSPDARRIAAVHRSSRSEVVVCAYPGSGPCKTVAVGADVQHDLCWTVDGKLIVSSNERGSYDLFEIEADGTRRRPLAPDPNANETEPVATPDGRYIVFVSDRSGLPALYRIDRDGNGLRALTTLPTSQGDRAPESSPDGRVVYFRRFDNGPTLWRVGIDGGAPEMIIGDRSARPSTPGNWESAFGATVSPDGRSLAFLYFSHNSLDGKFSPTQIAISDLSGRIVRSFPLPAALPSQYGDRERAEWSADGRAVYYRGREMPGNLWRQPVSGGSPTQVTPFLQRVEDYDWSKDGKMLACSRRTQLRDVVVITNFR